MRWSWLTLALIALTVACKKPYRIGEHVMVEWGKDKELYPAYIVDRKSETTYRVHFDGYDTICDENVTLDRIKARAPSKVKPPPPPRGVRCVPKVTAPPAGSSSAAPVAQYKPGDRVKVRWRGSVYNATVLEVVASDKFRLRYDGHESAWDETVPITRIVGKR